MIRIATAFLMSAAFLALPSASGATCQPEPASQWAPAGVICPPIYGEGIASRWDGPTVATNSCVYPWTDCITIQIVSLETGRSVIVQPAMWCHCYTGEADERIVDLNRAAVGALGLRWEDGLYPVSVEPAGVVMLPDTAVGEMSDFGHRPIRIGELFRMMGFEPDVAVDAAAHGQDAKRAYADYLRENQTTSERMMARVLYYLGCDVEPQQVVMGWIIDFLDRENKVVIEVDGSSHDGKQDYDSERDKAMRAGGYRVIRIESWEVPHILQQVARSRAEVA